MFKSHKPIRMCVVCKNRFDKTALFKLSQSGKGLYICNTCLNQNENILRKKLSKFVNFDNLNLKEKFLNGKCEN